MSFCDLYKFIQTVSERTVIQPFGHRNKGRWNFKRSNQTILNGADI